MMADTSDRLVGLDRTRLRWAVSFAAVTCLFAGGLWTAVRWTPPAVPPPGATEAAVLIDLQPVPVAPPAPPSPAPVETPAPSPPVPPPQVEPQPIAPPPDVPPPEPHPVPEPAPPKSPPAPAIVPETAVPLPPEPPRRPPPRRPDHPAVRHPAPPPPKAVATNAPEPAAPSAAMPAAPAPAAASQPNAVPNWHSELLNHLAQFKRYPSEALYRRQQGVVQLRFTMDRGGRVLSASVIKSSGYDALDQEALAMLQRSQPLPPPPPDVAGDTIALTVPVQFFLR